MKRLLMLLLCVSMIVSTFVSCDFHNMDVEFNMGKDEETKENSEIKDGYELIFTSLGDNTCALTEVYVYGNVGDKVLTIPEKSPNGERVVACHVDCIMTSVPIYIPKDIFEKDILGNAEHLTKFEKTQIENFFKYYSLNDPKAQNSEIIRNDWIKKFPFLEKIEGVYVFMGTTVMEFDVLHDVIEKAGFDDNAQRAATSEFLLSTQFVEDRSFIDNVKFPSNLDPFEKIIVPYGVRSVCLSGAKNVQQIILPDGVTTLEENAFTGNKKLEEIKIPETVEEIGTKAFYGCLSLQEIAIPSAVSKIEENLFADCVLLRKLILSEGVTEIGNEVLVGGRSSASLDYLFIPKTVEEISTDAFYRSSIEIIEYAGTAEEWNRKFTDKVNLDMVGVIKCLDGDIVIQE